MTKRNGRNSHSEMQKRIQFHLKSENAFRILAIFEVVGPAHTHPFAITYPWFIHSEDKKKYMKFISLNATHSYMPHSIYIYSHGILVSSSKWSIFWFMKYCVHCAQIAYTWCLRSLLFGQQWADGLVCQWHFTRNGEKLFTQWTSDCVCVPLLRRYIVENKGECDA